MRITFAPRGILQIDEARIMFTNFEGRGDKYNREGDRNFQLRVDDRMLTTDEVKDILGIYSDAYMKEDEEGNDILYIDDVPVITLDEALKAMGWNLKIKPALVDGGDRLITRKVKVAFNERGPAVYMVPGNGEPIKLDEDSVHRIDKIDISHVDLDIRPYDWEVNGNTGRTAYLQSMQVIQNITDRFARPRYEEDEEEAPFR